MKFVISNPIRSFSFCLQYWCIEITIYEFRASKVGFTLTRNSETKIKLKLGKRDKEKISSTKFFAKFVVLFSLWNSTRNWFIMGNINYVDHKWAWSGAIFNQRYWSILVILQDSREVAVQYWASAKTKSFYISLQNVDWTCTIRLNTDR